ncbi:MAG: hypothetical protein WCC94_00155 [Candidatus Bathyarchaeia archaeon]
MLKAPLLEDSGVGEARNSGGELHVGLGVLTFGYASGRHVEARGIFRIQSWRFQEALDAVRSELLVLWREYAQTLPTNDRTERRLRIQGWCTLRIEPRAYDSFVSIQEVIDSKYPNRKFVKTYAYPKDWWLDSNRKSELAGNQGDVTCFLDQFSQRIIGVDFDSHNEFKKLKTYFNCLYASNKDRMQVRISPSGRGLHIRLEQERSLSREERYDVRMALGDCKGRLVCSSRRQFDDVLFEMKRIKRRGHWAAWSSEMTVEPATLLALPMFSKVPREAYRR